MSTPNSLDTFTRARIRRALEEIRARTGQLPTLQDFAAAGFPKETIERAVREKLLERYYVTLTNGSIVKGYKLGEPGP